MNKNSKTTASSNKLQSQKCRNIDANPVGRVSHLKRDPGNSLAFLNNMLLASKLCYFVFKQKKGRTVRIKKQTRNIVGTFRSILALFGLISVISWLFKKIVKSKMADPGRAREAGRFAHKSIRTHRGRFADTTLLDSHTSKSFRLHWKENVLINTLTG